MSHECFMCKKKHFTKMHFPIYLGSFFKNIMDAALALVCVQRNFVSKRKSKRNFDSNEKSC